MHALCDTRARITLRAALVPRQRQLVRPTGSARFGIDHAQLAVRLAIASRDRSARCRDRAERDRGTRGDNGDAERPGSGGDGGRYWRHASRGGDCCSSAEAERRGGEWLQPRRLQRWGRCQQPVNAALSRRAAPVRTRPVDVPTICFSSGRATSDARERGMTSGRRRVVLVRPRPGFGGSVPPAARSTPRLPAERPQSRRRRGGSARPASGEPVEEQHDGNHEHCDRADDQRDGGERPERRRLVLPTRDRPTEPHTTRLLGGPGRETSFKETARAAGRWTGSAGRAARAYCRLAERR